MDAGYEPSDFIEYCCQYREPDIDSWTFEELEDIVQGFKDHVRQDPAETELLPKVVIEIEDESEDHNNEQEEVSVQIKCFEAEVQVAADMVDYEVQTDEIDMGCPKIPPIVHDVYIQAFEEDIDDIYIEPEPQVIL